MSGLENIVKTTEIRHPGVDDVSCLDRAKGYSAYFASKAVDVIGTAAIAASGLGLTIGSYMGTEYLLDKYVGKGEHYDAWPVGGYHNDMIYFLTLLPASLAGLTASIFTMITIGVTASDYSHRLKSYSYQKLRKPEPRQEIL